MDYSKGTCIILNHSDEWYNDLNDFDKILKNLEIRGFTWYCSINGTHSKINVSNNISDIISSDNLYISYDRKIANVDTDSSKNLPEERFRYPKVNSNYFLDNIKAKSWFRLRESIND